ncbi:MAG TPA: hypothetical protein VF339_18540 [Gammaproteobacteria bacterium]
MTVARLFSELAWSGVRLELEPDGRIHVIGRLTGEQREVIRLHRDLVVRRLRLDQGAGSGHSLGAAETLQ